MKPSPAQRNIQEWKAQISIRSYSDTSPSVSGTFGPSHLSVEEISKLKDCVTASAPPLSLSSHLCYACHTTLTSRNSRGIASVYASKSSGYVPLPVWVESMPNSNALHQNGIGDDIRTRRSSQQDMRAQIEEFIISDE